MKSILTPIILVLALFAPALANPIPESLDLKLQAVLKRLHDAPDENPYTTDQFVADLKQIGAQDNALGQWKDEADVDTVKLAMLKLASDVSRPDVAKKIDETRSWYGSYDYDIPAEQFREKWGKSAILRTFGKSLDQHRADLKSEAKKTASQSGNVERLHDEHAAIEYLPAWKFWLMAPPSKERSFMLVRIAQALEKINDESVIPLLLESMKIEVGRVSDGERSGVAKTFVDLIVGLPGETALEALLECNRFALEGNFAGDDYFDSLTRHIVRRLASRRSYADQLIDPKMKEIIDRKGYNEKPEDIPLTDELWKNYKPLVAARLKSRNAETPEADIALLEAAQKIMPNK